MWYTVKDLLNTDLLSTLHSTSVQTKILLCINTCDTAPCISVVILSLLLSSTEEPAN
jgi:hypothetical protein